MRKSTIPIQILIVWAFSLAGCITRPLHQPTIPPTLEPAPGIEFLLKKSSEHIRVMSYNVGWDSIFPDDDPLNDPFREIDRSEAFVRILQAVRPDVLCLQEINPLRDPQQVAEILDIAFPLEEGETWQVHSGQDNLIAARFDLSMEDAEVVIGAALTGRGHAMALVDLPDEDYVQDLYLVCAHFKSQGGASNIQARQAQADAIIAWIRDAQTPGDEIDLPASTPFLILGDLNVYDTDPAHHLTTLVSGDIQNEARYGQDIRPDWDGTNLEDALPHHNTSGEEIYTWRDDTQEFNPGILDRILYSGSVIVVEHSFVLNTMTLSVEALVASGLMSADVAVNPQVGDYDHLPLVVDLSFQELSTLE